MLHESFYYNFLFFYCKLKFVVISSFTRCACAICFKEKVILTGGLNTLDKVTVYNSKGWVEDLPSLKTGRYYHACGSFVTSDKKMVRKQKL